MPRPQYEIGRVKNGMVIVEQLNEIDKYGHGLYIAKCPKCSCLFKVSSNGLSRRRSCGCEFEYDLEYKINRGLRIAYQQYAQRHLYRKFSASTFIDFDEFKSMAIADCEYCGSRPSNSNAQTKNYQGIDRISSSHGYTSENTVPCCWTCNRMKGKLSPNMFLAHVQRIARYQVY